MKITSNYHTHTKRCGHALDEDVDYVEGAIELGITDLGFSDHVPFKGYDFYGMRQNYEMLDDYVSSIRALREAYKDKITLHIGYEAEFLPETVDEYVDMLQNKGIEYFICGQHCFLRDGKQVWYNGTPHSEDAVIAYVDAVIAAMRSGLFTYIAHPDHFMNGYRVWDEFSERQSRRLFEAAERYNFPLEINVAGIRFAEHKHRTNGEGRPIENLYPHGDFWTLASEYKIDGIIGIDAHRKYDFLDGVEQEAIAFALERGVHLLDKISLKTPKF